MVIVFLVLVWLISGIVFVIFEDPVIAVAAGIGIAIWTLHSYFASAHSKKAPPAPPPAPSRRVLPSPEGVRTGLAVVRETIAVVDQIQLRRSPNRKPPAPPQRYFRAGAKR